MCAEKMYKELSNGKQELIITYNETNEFYLFFIDGKFEIRSDTDDNLVIDCSEKFELFFGGIYLFLTDPKIYETNKKIIFVQIDEDHVLFVHKAMIKEHLHRVRMDICEYIPIRVLQKWLDCKISEYYSIDICESKMKNVNKIVYKP